MQAPKPPTTVATPTNPTPTAFPGGDVGGSAPRPFRFLKANDDFASEGRRAADYQGVTFSIQVNPNGYAWWYVDALSDDGKHGLTMIAFIGSVFSPYYAWSGRRAPYSHCALNVALYGGDKQAWAMTERPSRLANPSETHFAIGPSALRWDGDALCIDVNETTAPFPSRLRGSIKVHPSAIGEGVFFIDPNGRHRWRPVSPFSRVEVAFSDPSISWSGHGYFDCNDGDEPLEDAFSFWDWSRTIMRDGKTAILYNTDMIGGETQAAALLIDKQGGIDDFALPPQHALAPGFIWRIKRRTRSEEGGTARVVKTLEDTPFYTRSVVETRLFGEQRQGVHESLDGARLRNPFVKALLPFRMPRWPIS
ncbi:MAG: hypothetical protein AAF850_06095 [Pseudomonadota bacterium]